MTTVPGPAMPMPLYTASYRTWRPEFGVPVRITVGRPKPNYFPHPYEEWLTLAPWELFQHGRYLEQPLDVELRLYRQRLHKRKARMVEEAAALAARVDGVGAVLLCYEDVWRGEICHRRWFADWAVEHLGWEIRELTPDGQPSWPPPNATDRTKPAKKQDSDVDENLKLF